MEARASPESVVQWIERRLEESVGQPERRDRRLGWPTIGRLIEDWLEHLLPAGEDAGSTFRLETKCDWKTYRRMCAGGSIKKEKLEKTVEWLKWRDLSNAAGPEGMTFERWLKQKQPNPDWKALVDWNRVKREGVSELGEVPEGPASRDNRPSGLNWIGPDSGRRTREIPTALSAEDLLQELATKACADVSAYACSIYMLDRDSSLYVLRESTILTPFLGRSVLDLTRDMDKPRCGITAWCAATGRSRLVLDVRKDEKWSCFGMRPPPDISQVDHCELVANELGSVIVVPFGPNWRPLGVLRVVRKARPTAEAFTPEDLTKLEKLVEDFRTTLTESQSFARLIDVGLTLNVGEMCHRACRVLAHLVGAKGVSAFILDDQASNDKRLVYRGRGSTGLFFVNVREQRELNTEECEYVIPNDEGKYVTAFVAHRKCNVTIEDVRSFKFKDRLGISREPGPGKYSERFAADPSKGAGPIMLVPLFFRERFDDFPAMGVLRASRPAGSKGFEPADQRRFLALADRLAKAILRARYHALLERIALARLEQPVEVILAEVAADIPKLLGGEGCSVFAGNPILKMVATNGRLKDRFQRGGIKPYDVGDEKNRGITGSAVALKRTILYNSLEDRRRRAADEGITGSGRNLCEIRENPPPKLVVVPLMVGDECLGAVRIPKTSRQMPFSGEDVSLLETIGRHLGVLLWNSCAFRESRKGRISRGRERKSSGSSGRAFGDRAAPRAGRGGRPRSNRHKQST